MLCFQQTRTALLQTGANAASQDNIVFIIPLFKKYIFICNKIEIFGVVLSAKFWPAQTQLQNMRVSANKHLLLCTITSQ